jgi:hypothetical protein
MQDASEAGQFTVSRRWVDIIVAIAFMAVAGVVIADSLRVGAQWLPDGPEAGYFPFYVGTIMLISSAATALMALLSRTPDNVNFVGRAQLWSVMQVLIPAAVYMALIPFLGLYVSSAIFISFFMAWIGKYSPLIIAPVAIGVPLFLFMLFERWFLVPLPKGPLENMLGY